MSWSDPTTDVFRCTDTLTYHRVHYMVAIRDGKGGSIRPQYPERWLITNIVLNYTPEKIRLYLLMKNVLNYCYFSLSKCRLNLSTTELWHNYQWDDRIWLRSVLMGRLHTRERLNYSSACVTPDYIYYSV